MSLLRRPGKSFTQPAFWTQQYEDLSNSLLSPWSGAPERETIENNFQAYVSGAYKASGVVAACMFARQLVFSEARLQWRRYTDGRPGDLFGTPALGLLEKPWPNGTTGELLARMDVDASLAGNFFATTADDRGELGRNATGPGRRVAHMRPDWVTLVIGSRSGNPFALDAKVVAFEYQPQGVGVGAAPEPVLLLPDEVVHYSPLPDPIARFRGMSWLTPIIRQIMADKAATSHKLKFFENAATPNLSVNWPKEVPPEKFRKYVAEMNQAHKGAGNAYKTLFTAGGADVTVVGADMKQLDFKATQGAGETMVAANARVHPVIVGLSEGLQGSSLNEGNYRAARRGFADGTMRPLWRMAAASLATIARPAPEGAELTYDARQVAFLREDSKDEAEIQATQAQALRNLIDAGWDPDAAVAYVQNNDLGALVGNHSGLFSVQLQKPGTGRGGAAA